MTGKVVVTVMSIPNRTGCCICICLTAPLLVPYSAEKYAGHVLCRSVAFSILWYVCLGCTHSVKLSGLTA